jgi:DNA-binding FadR family transcriptional regulator
MFDKKILSHKVALEIKQMIIDKELKPGDKLPNELKLCESLSVARTTLREAIKILVSSNILVIRRGTGTFVSDKPGITKDPLGVTFIDDDNLLLHFFEVRLLVEPEMAEYAAERRSEKELECIEKALEKVSELISKGENHTEADIEFHNEIAKATKNPILQRIVPVINDGIIGGYEQTKNNPEASEVVLEHHKKIFEAIKSGDKKAAKKYMKEHILYGMTMSSDTK